MEIQSKVIKRKTGKSKGKYIVRIRYFDQSIGRHRNLERHADRKGDATDLRNRLVEELKASDGKSEVGVRMAFKDLADHGLTSFYKPAVLHDGRKIDGVRAFSTVAGQIRLLCEFFGKQPIQEITKESLVEYKVWRLRTGSERLGRPLKIATVNRELSTMRRLMRYAYSNGWVLRDIFFNSRVIDSSAEMERTRLLSLEEEQRLLASCQGEREVVYKRTLRGREETVRARQSVDNPKLKAMILLALDGGLRRGEILQLTWDSFDFEGRTIRILGTHTKTERERLAPLSDRCIGELRKVRHLTTSDRPFEMKSFKRSWATATRLAGIDGLQFRDLRRTAITRWQQHEIPLALAGKLAGHTQLQTTMKHYTSTDEIMVRGVSERIDEAHRSITQELVSQAVN